MTTLSHPDPESDPGPEPAPTSLEDSYHTLTSFLSTTASSFELEILPSSHPTILHDGLSLGIPKKILIQCFLIARQLFLLALPSASAHPVPDPPPPSQKPDNQTLLCATAVLLLYDPEHLSAINWRKRRLVALAASHDPHPIDHHPILQSAVSAEFCLLTSLLTSPLPKAPKSPTLWSHRHWLLKNHARWLLPALPMLVSVQAELDVVLLAAGRHAANYGAFQYGRLLLNRYTRHVSFSRLEIEGLVEMMQRWCLRHPRDISGWGFLGFLLGWGLEGMDEEDGNGLIRKVREGVKEWVTRLVWRGGSVEWFLKEIEELGKTQSHQRLQ